MCVSLLSCVCLIVCHYVRGDIQKNWETDWTTTKMAHRYTTIIIEYIIGEWPIQVISGSYQLPTKEIFFYEEWKKTDTGKKAHTIKADNSLFPQQVISISTMENDFVSKTTNIARKEKKEIGINDARVW